MLKPFQLDIENTHLTPEKDGQLSQKTFHNHKYFKVLNLVILLLLSLTQSQAKSVKTPEPWSAQAGTTSFTISSVDTFATMGDLKFGSTFAANLRTLQLVPQTFQIVLGFRKLDALFSPQGSIAPSTSISTPLTGDSSLSTSFTLTLYMEDQRLLTEIKANYLLIGAELITTLMVKSFFIQIMPPTDTACDALGGATTCTYNKAVNIPALTYKIYLSICAFDIESKSTSSATIPPSQTATATKLELNLKSFSLTNLELEFKIDKFKFTTLKLFAIIVHPSMFDQTVIKKTMFIELVAHITSAAPYSKVFSQQVISTNYFVGFYSFKGFKWSFDIAESTPNDLFLGAIISVGSSLLDFFAFVMYGYTQTCQDFRDCLACYTPPNFECTQCEFNFVFTVPYNVSNPCQCPPPFSIVSGVCDNHQFGCIIVLRLSDNSLECKQCDFNKMLILNPTTKICECKPFFAMDASFLCQEICGDGVVVNSQCDDGNIFSGDGCSSSCILETGFECDTKVQPTKCKSQSMLFYKIDKITKQLRSNSAIIKLKLPILTNYPLPVLKQHFNPISKYINFRIIVSMAPYTEIIVTDLEIVETDPSGSISLSFSFNQSIEGTSGKLILNYENTLYFNYTQTLDFSLSGDNAALIYESQIESYKTLSYGMLAGTAINSLLLFIGFISPKFIGLESVLTLQLIFFSQTLVYDHMKFPVGFLFLQTLQYSTGFNNIFDFTQYISTTQMSKKMLHIKRHKTIIENFNINFIILLISFIALFIIFVIRSKQQKLALQEKEQRKTEELQKSKKKQPKDKENLSVRKINDIVFYISNQVAFWLFLPLVSSIAAEMIIENSTLIQVSESNYFLSEVGELISIPAFFMIYGIILSNFGNIWQSSESMSNAYQRPEQIYYKRWLFVYLTIVGFLVLYLNGIYYMKVYTSVIVLIIHLINMIVIFSINPYKMSLKVHTIGMLLNNAIYLVFLIIINFINYLDKMQPNIAMFFGYAMIAFCVASIVVTIIRLYYELRYGRQLEMQLQEERILRQKEESLRNEALMKSKAQQMENQARQKVSQKQRFRERNVYLHENQVNQDQKKELVNWLENRPIQKKVKEAYYFQKYAEKPLDWLKVNDAAKYELKINEINQKLHNDQLRAGQKLQDQKYVALTSQLRKQVKTIKKIQQEKIRMHEKGLKTNTNYAMKTYKDNQDKFVHQAYELKK